MKKIILAIIVVILIVVMGIFEQIFVVGALDELITRIEYVEEAIDDPVESKKRFDETLEWWLKERDLVEAFVSHNDTKEISYRISELEGAINAESIDDAKMCCTIVIDVTRHTKHIVEFSWDQVV